MARKPNVNLTGGSRVFTVERRATGRGARPKGDLMHTTLRRRLLAAAAITTVAASGAAVSAATASSTTGTTTSGTTATAAPFCGITWGSLPKSTSPGLLWSGRVEGRRSGQHSCYDRVVFDVGRGAGTLGYSVRYVSAVTSPGSGYPVAVAGGARLQVTVNAPSMLAASTTNYPGWRTFRQLRSVGSFEGYTDYGLGVRARLPMRASVIKDADGGRRLVVDVAHAW
jgi:hypothetical protein